MERDNQLSSGHVHVDWQRGIKQAGSGACQSDGAGTAAAGQRFSRAAFPDSYANCVAAEQFREFHVRAIGEGGVAFKRRSETFHGNLRQLSDEEYQMWVSGICFERLVQQFGNFEIRKFDTGCKACRGWQMRGESLWGCESDADGAADVWERIETEYFGMDTASMHFESHAAGGELAVVQPERHAAESISAERSFAAVGVEHSHACVAVWFTGGQHKYEAIAANGAMAVAEPLGEFLRAGWNGLVEGIDEDIVIATAMHANPAERRHLWSPVIRVHRRPWFVR